MMGKIGLHLITLCADEMALGHHPRSQRHTALDTSACRSGWIVRPEPREDKVCNPFQTDKGYLSSANTSDRSSEASSTNSWMTPNRKTAISSFFLSVIKNLLSNAFEKPYVTFKNLKSAHFGLMADTSDRRQQDRIHFQLFENSHDLRRSAVYQRFDMVSGHVAHE